MNLIILTFLFLFNARAFTLIDTEPFTPWPTNQITIDWSNDGCEVSLAPYVEAAVKKWNSIHTSRMKFKKGQDIAIPVADVITAYAGLTLTNPVIACDPDFEANFGLYMAVIAPGILNGRLIPGIYIFNSQVGSTQSMSTGVPMGVQHFTARAMGSFAGLGSSQFAAAIMHPVTGGRTQLAVSQDDADGLSYLYPNQGSLDDLFGCGTVRNVPPNNSFQEFFIFLLLIPLMLAWRIRNMSDFRTQ